MAWECEDLIKIIDSVLKGQLDKWDIDDLTVAKKPLEGRFGIFEFLSTLEKFHPENEISSQLRPLFVQALNVFSEILSHVEGQGGTSEALSIMSKVLIKRKLSKVLKIISLRNIAERIKASKPSRSSSCKITMKMVEFVAALLLCTEAVSHGVVVGRGVVGMELGKKLHYLRAFIILTANRCIENEHMKDLFIYAEDVAYLAARHCFLWLDKENALDPDFSTFLERTSLFRPELRQIYMSILIQSKSSQSNTTMNGLDVFAFVSSLQDNLIELLKRDATLKVAFDDRILWLQEGLFYVSRFLGDIESQGTTAGKLNVLLSHIEGLSIETAILIYSYYDEEKDKIIEVENVPFLLQLKFNKVKLEVDLVQLLKRQANIIAPLKDFSDYVWEELIFLETFFRDAAELCKAQTEIADFFILIQSVISQTRSAVTSLSHYLEQEDLAREIKPLHFQFLLKFKFIEAAIRQMCPSFSASSTLDHPTINLLNFLPINFEIIDSYSSMRKSSKTSSSDSPKMDGVLMGFHGYILDNLLMKDETNPTFTVANEVKKFYYGLLLLVTYLIDPLIYQCIDYKNQNNLSKGFGTEAESSRSLSFEEVNLVLQFLTVAFWLIKSEGSLMDLLKHKATLKAQVLCLIESVHEELIFVRAILMDFLRQHIELNKLHDILMHAEVAAQKLARVSSSFCESFKDRSSDEKMRVLLSDLLQEIESVKVEIRKLCFQFQVLEVSPCNMTNGEGLINLLLNHQDKVSNDDAGSFYESFIDGSNTVEMTLSLSNLLQEIESVKVEEVRKVCFQVEDASPCEMSKTDGEGFIKLLLTQQVMVPDYDTGLISSLDNQISAVKEKLVQLGSLLVDIVQYRHIHVELKDLANRVQDKEYVCFFSVKGYRPAWYYMLYLSDAKQLLKFVEAEVKVICLKVPDSSTYIFPRTNGLGFLNCFLGKLEELLQSKLDWIVDLKCQIGSVKEGLLCLKSSVDCFTQNYGEHDEVYDLMTSITVMTYKAEYVIDSCLACSHPVWYKVLWISEVVDSMKLINKGVRETCERKEMEGTVQKVTKYSTNLAPTFSANTPRECEELEGFQDTMDELKRRLLGGSPQLDVIAIVGMPGLGKTTLAKKIYSDPVVTSHFDVHAQCLVTQLYSWRDLLLTILNDVLEPAGRNEKEDGELADELRRFLLTKRFLILIDDVWDHKVWDNLRMCFGDARNRSRIMLTTRLSDVANYVKCESDPHHLRLFRDDESWTLLQKQVFQGKSCPPELADVGFRIAKSCKGLPLSIVLVAGVLKQKKKKPVLWDAVEQSLHSQSIGSLEESMSIIGFSYMNLPDHLKPCFLYFGGFLKGKDIHVSKLSRLWTAEGFVQANMEKKTEDTAQDFLEDLIRRNLVMGSEKRPNGKVKTCRIHDLLHKFCVEKAKQENFLLQINSGEDVFPEQLKEYRLFVHSYQDEIDLWRPSRSNVRSLLFNSTDQDNLLWPRDISFMFDSFKLIKVLDLESFNIGGTFPSQIQYLTHMRYFAAQTDANSIPSSIAKLWNLETLVVRGLGGEMILPCSLLKMVKLRHVHVNHRVSFGLSENMDDLLAKAQLANLETFSTPRLSYGEDGEKILRKMPKLRKLSCIFSGTFGYSRKVMGRCVLFPRLEFLSQLESLKLVSNNFPAKLPHEFNFPSKLRELTLSKFRLPWTQISTVAELPNLEILKLCLRAFEGDEWEVKDSEFPELKYLKLDNLKVAKWSVSDDAFPKLERLVLMKCKQLEKIPSHFDDAVSLKSIEVKWCNWAVANSAQEILTTQHEDMANHAFTVAIQPPDWAKNSPP